MFGIRVDFRKYQSVLSDCSFYRFSIVFLVESTILECASIEKYWPERQHKKNRALQMELNSEWLKSIKFIRNTIYSLFIVLLQFFLFNQNPFQMNEKATRLNCIWADVLMRVVCFWCEFSTALRMCSRFFLPPCSRCTFFCVLCHAVVFCWFFLMESSINEDLIVLWAYSAAFLLFMPVQMNWDNGDWALSSFRVSNPINSLLFLQMNFCCPLSFSFSFSNE